MLSSGDKLAHWFLVCLSTLCMSVSSLESVGAAVTLDDTTTGQGRVLRGKAAMTADVHDVHGLC